MVNKAKKIPPLRLITSGQDPCREARVDRNINTNSTTCQNKFLQFSLYSSYGFFSGNLVFAENTVLSMHATVNVTAVGIYWRSGWICSTGRAGLTMQTLPRVPGDRVGFIFTHFKHLESRFQPSTSPVFIGFIIPLHKEGDNIMGQLI